MQASQCRSREMFYLSSKLQFNQRKGKSPGVNPENQTEGKDQPKIGQRAPTCGAPWGKILSTPIPVLEPSELR